MSKLNKYITYFLGATLIFLLVFLSMQKYYDSQKKQIGIDINDDEIHYIEKITEKENLSETESIENLFSEQNVEKNSINIFGNTEYTKDDIIELYIPSKDAIYEKNGVIINLEKGKVNPYTFEISNFVFDENTRCFNFEILMKSLTSAETIISSNNFKLLYENKEIKNINIESYTINRDTSKILVIFKLDDEVNLRNINIKFFKFIYEDDFNIREFPIY